MSLLAGRYELRGLLGRGGMGEVYEAVAKGSDGFVRRVAIKRLHGEAVSSNEDRVAFLDEARIASHLHHGGIVGVYDYGVVDGAPFQVLELVDGWTARSVCESARHSGAPMPITVALHVVIEAAHALHFAHTMRDAKGAPLRIVHRDVKPSNILLSRSGDVKVGDFGIAKAIDRVAKTTEYSVKGTPGFMAPEQLLGGDVDARADVFALGCTLHALITGKSPMPSRDAEQRVLLGAEVSVSSELPPDVRDIVARATCRTASQRIATAQELARSLGRVLAPRLTGDAKSELLAWLGALSSASVAGEAPIDEAAPTGTMTVGEIVLESERGGTRVFSSVSGGSAGPSAIPGGGSAARLGGGNGAGSPPSPSGDAGHRGRRRAPPIFAISAAATVILGVGVLLSTRLRTAAVVADGAPPGPSADAVASALISETPAENDADTLEPLAVDASMEASSRPPPRSQPTHVNKNGACFCEDKGTSTSLCPRPLVQMKPHREDCSCVASQGRLMHADGKQRYPSVSGLGGELCEGFESSTGRHGSAVQGMTFCRLCASEWVYDGPNGAACRGLSGYGAEVVGELYCRHP